MNVRLNSQTTTPSWLSPRVRMLTIPTSGFELDSRLESTSLWA